MTNSRGVWVSYSWDVGPVDVRPHVDEITALRYINRQGYGAVMLVSFGSDICEEIERQKAVLKTIAPTKDKSSSESISALGNRNARHRVTHDTDRVLCGRFISSGMYTTDDDLEVTCVDCQAYIRH